MPEPIHQLTIRCHNCDEDEFRYYTWICSCRGRDMSLGWPTEEEARAAAEALYHIG